LKDFNAIQEKDGPLRTALRIPSDAPLIGTIGRLNAQKAPLDFVRLAHLLFESMPNAHFVWIGDGDLKHAALALCKQLGLERVMHFAGTRTDVPVVLREFNCFVLTSHWEAFPLALLEAMAVALPVVATRLPGVEEAVEENVSGYLHPVGDLGAMRDSIRRIVSDPELAKSLGCSGRRRVEKSFTRRKMISEIEQIYLRILSRNG
jgi:glycosyltransferase involved in cell wall biosynthesis